MRSPRQTFRKSAFALAAAGLILASPLVVPSIPVSAEFLVNTYTTGNQRDSAVAMDASGDFVVVWSGPQNSYDIFGQRFNAAGQPQGAEFQVNTYTTGPQTLPSVAMDAVGNFVVAWQSGGQESPSVADLGVFARRYSADGSVLGGEIAVTRTPTGNAADPVVAMDADGDFVVAWQDTLYGTSDVFVRRFNPAGGEQGLPVRVNTYTTSTQDQASVAMDADGNFVVAWRSNSQPGDLLAGIYAQRFTSAGFALGGELHVNTYTTSVQRFPAIAMAAGGAFVVAWQSEGQESASANDYGIYAQRYDELGQPDGGEFRVNTYTTGRQQQPSIDMDAMGNFVLAWRSEQEAQNGGVFGRQYDASGRPRGGEIALNTVRTNIQAVPAVAVDADGDTVFVWQSAGQEVSFYSIFARRYQGFENVDLSVDQFDSADPIATGSPLTYTFLPSNLHPPVAPTGIAAIDSQIGAATAPRLTISPPAGATGLSTSHGPGAWSCSFPGSKIRCDYLLPLQAGEEAAPVSFTYTPSVAPGTRLGNVVVLAAQTLDQDLANNRSVERTLVACPVSTVQLDATDYVVAEGQASLVLSVTRTGGNANCSPAASVQFDVSGASATAGLDFIDTSGTLSWPAGDFAPRTVTISLLNDTLDEINERAVLSLSSASGASLGAVSRAPLVITDDDASPRINFTSAGQTVTEGPALLNLTVQLGAVSGRDVSVPLSFGGTAGNGSDYFRAASALTIPAGQTSASTQIEIADDAASEGNETVIVGMGAVSGATVGSLNTHTVTITDNDAAPVQPTVSFTAASSSGDEATARSAVVTLSAASAQSITVPFTVTGTAAPGSDYSLNRTTPITFNPGVTQLGIQIMPVDDTSNEPSETVILTLGAPTGATLGATTVHTRTIADNDP